MTRKKGNRLNEIIEAAISEFIEKGYEIASMESIAKRAKLSKGGLYHHFKSKTEILYMANVKLTEPVQQMMRQIKADKSVAEGLNLFITNYLVHWNSHKQELRLYFLTMSESFRNRKILGFYRESAHQTFDFFESLFREGQETGVFKELDARALAVAFISCLDGFLGYMLIDPSIPVDKMEKELQNTFIQHIIR